MEVKVLILDLSTTKKIAEFQEEYKKLIKDGYRVEESYSMDMAVVFLLEKWE